MKNGSEIGKIKAPLFITGLVVLLMNDFYFKYAYHNELTGKLSDIAGLFIFPFFFSALWPTSRKGFYIATAVAFTLWKSPLSQPLVDLANSIGIGTSRTVDYSDLLTLAILPFSYRYLKNGAYGYKNRRKPLIATLAVVTVFSFCATTLQRQEVEIRRDTGRIFMLPLSKEEVLHRLSPAYSNTDTLIEENNYSHFYLYFHVPELKADVKAAAEIYSLSPRRTAIKLDSVTTAYVTGGLFSGADQGDLEKVKMLTSSELEDFFEKHFVKKLEENTAQNFLFYKIKVVQNGDRGNN